MLSDDCSTWGADGVEDAGGFGVDDPCDDNAARAARACSNDWLLEEDVFVSDETPCKEFNKSFNEFCDVFCACWGCCCACCCCCPEFCDGKDASNEFKSISIN